MFKILSTYINPSRIYSLPEGCAKIYRVYKNKNAKDLFMKAQKAENVDERKKLIDAMGEYDIVTEKDKMPSKNRIMQFYRGLLNAF